MRFGELRGLTSLPISRLIEQFRNEEVLTVLPVLDAATSRETVLVATRPALAILTSLRVPAGQWVTSWARWDTVGITDPDVPPGQEDEDAYGLDVLVGGRSFQARLQGEPGRRALRDFVVAVRVSTPTKAARP